MKKIIWRLILPLCVWGIIAVVAFSFPVIQEPENLPDETWSYYNGRSEGEQFLIRNRNAVLFVLFLCAILPEVFFLIRDYVKPKK